MKRLFYFLALILTTSFVTSCAQHDSTSPDTSGAVPRDQPGAGVDTATIGTNPTTTPNMSNDSGYTDTTKNKQ